MIYASNMTSSLALPYADVRIMSPLVDGIVLVACSGVTTGEAMARNNNVDTPRDMTISSVSIGFFWIFGFPGVITQ